MDPRLTLSSYVVPPPAASLLRWDRPSAACSFPPGVPGPAWRPLPTPALLRVATSLHSSEESRDVLSPFAPQMGLGAATGRLRWVGAPQHLRVGQGEAAASQHIQRGLASVLRPLPCGCRSMSPCGGGGSAGSVACR